MSEDWAQAGAPLAHHVIGFVLFSLLSWCMMEYALKKRAHRWLDAPMQTHQLPKVVVTKEVPCQHTTINAVSAVEKVNSGFEAFFNSGGKVPTPPSSKSSEEDDGIRLRNGKVIVS